MKVWDVERNEMVEVTCAEAAGGLMRYARTLRPGEPARAEVERQALELALAAQTFAAIAAQNPEPAPF